MDPIAVWVDAFTDEPFAGNPAVVVLLDSARDGGWMQALAREMGVSETAFVVQRDAGAGPAGGAERGSRDFDLRWFTPATEVDLCGHATLASAHALWQEGRLGPREPARFHTRSGILTAARRDPWIEMDFPSTPPAPESAPAGLAEAIGASICWSGRARIGDWLIELADESTVRGLAPDFARLAAVPARGIVVTARADPGAGHDFVSRFFGPAVGIEEDPVTGSAHCALAPFWAERLGRLEMVGFQASARGGIVRVRVAGERVILGGKAVTILRGALAGETGRPDKEGA